MYLWRRGGWHGEDAVVTRTVISLLLLREREEGANLPKLPARDTFWPAIVFSKKRRLMRKSMQTII